MKHTGGCLVAFSLKHAYGSLHGSCCSQHTHPQTSLITQVWLASWHMWLLVNGWFIGAPSPPLPSVITQITMNVSTSGLRFLFRLMFIAGNCTVLADDPHHMLVILSICCGSSYILKHLKIQAVQTEIICLDLWSPSFHFSVSPSAYLLQDLNT